MERIMMELNGDACMALEDAVPNKQQIMSSRSFGNYVYDIDQLGEAVASYIAIAAEKLRSQGSLAGMVQVYVRPNPHKEGVPQYQHGLTVPLTQASDDTLLLTRAALFGLKRIYRTGFAYQKAGISLLNLTDGATPQLDLFSNRKDNTRLMATMDRGSDLGQGIEKGWRMKRGNVSPGYCPVASSTKATIPTSARPLMMMSA